MKKIYVIIIIALLGLQVNLFAQDGGVSIGKGDSDADPSAILELFSKNKGLLIPRLSSSEREGISSPASGLLVYDTNLTGFYYWTGSRWKAISGINSGTGTTLPGSGGEGDLFYNTSTDSLMVYVNSVWKPVGSSKQVLSLNETTLKLLEEGTENSSEIDLSVLFQELSLNGTTLSISDGNSIDLSSVLVGDMLKSDYDLDGNNRIDNADKINGLTVETSVPAGAVFTDSQALSVSGSTLSITGGNSVTLPTGSSTGDMRQSVYDSNTNNLVDNAEKVNNLSVETAVPSGAVFTDDQNAAEVTYDNSTSGLTATDVNAAVNELKDSVDLKISSTDLATVATSGSYNDLLDKPTITDDQAISDLSLSGTTLQLTLEGDANGQQTVDLSSLQDGTGTDDQNAAEVTYDNSTSGLTATDVNAAVNELKDSVDLKISSTDLATVATSGSYNDLLDKPTITDDQDATEVTLSTGYVKPASSGALVAGESIETSLGKLEKGLENVVTGSGEVNVQADWSVSDAGSDAYILNKPTIPDVSGLSTTAALNDSLTTVRGELSDSTAQVRSEIPDVSGLATTTALNDSVTTVRGELSDSTAQVRSEIPDVSGLATTSDLGDSIALVRSEITDDQNATEVTLSSGYVKPASGGALVAGEDIETSLGKLEKGLESAVAGGGDANVQVDWSITDTGSDAYIKNKPTIPDVSGFATTGELADSTAQVRSEIPDVSGLATTTALNDSLTTVRGELSDSTAQVRSEIPDVSGLANTIELADSTAQVRSEIPDVSGLATTTALNDSLTTVRGELSDSTAQVRSEIPDVSGLATTGELADSTAQVRSEIPDVSGLATTTALNDSLTTVRGELSDSTAQVRSEIPDVSGLATTGELADSTAQVRSEIPVDLYICVSTSGYGTFQAFFQFPQRGFNIFTGNQSTAASRLDIA